MSTLAAMGLAVIVGGLGVACLFAAWRRWLPRWGLLVGMGWLLLAASTGFWVRAGGAEFGVVYALLFIPLVAWLAVLVNRDVRSAKRRQQALEPTPFPRARGLGRHLLLFILAVPLAGVATLLASVALPLALPWQDIDQMVLAVFLFPVLWGVAAYWVCADPRWQRPTLVLLAGALASVLCLSV